jgi:WD40 repeat protein
LVIASRFATGAQQVNALDCFSAFSSTVAVWAGSNKQIGIYDAAVDSNIRVMDEGHARSIHSLEVVRGSRFADVHTGALHIFATAGLDKSVKLWDMRQANPVRVFLGHVNSAVKVGLCWSPCARFVAVGSEDRSVYVYDAGSGAVLSKLTASDTVTSVRFHPLLPVMAVSAANGSVTFFSTSP